MSDKGPWRQEWECEGSCWDSLGSMIGGSLRSTIHP